MALAFSAGTFTAGVVTSGANNPFTGGSTARAICVMVHENTSASSLVTSVTYGGTALDLIDQEGEPTEAGSVYLYWRDNIAASGTPNVVVTHSSTDVRFGAVTFTSAASTGAWIATNANGLSASVANPSWPMPLPTGTFFCCEVIHSGLTTMTTTPGTGWALIPGFTSATDIGAQGWGAAIGTFSNGASCVGTWSAATADDFVGASVAFFEGPASHEPPDLNYAPIQLPRR
jgi:hypothetical protein